MNELKERALLVTIGRLYDAALEHALWPEVLAQAGKLISASGALFLLQDEDDRQSSLAHCITLSEQIGSDGEAKFWKPQSASKLRLSLPPIENALDREAGDAVQLRSNFSKQFCQCHGAPYYLGTMVSIQENRVAFVGFYRSPAAGAFDTEAISRFERLKPHLVRSARLSSNFLQLEGQIAAEAGGTDLLNIGVLLLGSDARILFANREARRLLGDADGVRSERGRLAVEGRARHDDFRRKLAAATRAKPARSAVEKAEGTTSSGAASCALILERSSGRQPLGCILVPIEDPPIHTYHSIVSRRAACMVFLIDPEKTAAALRKTMITLYDLTPGEAKLVEALVEDASLVRAANRIGVTKETARSRLKTVFAKTQTHSQADLIALTLRSVAPLSVG